MTRQHNNTKGSVKHETLLSNNQAYRLNNPIAEAQNLDLFAKAMQNVNDEHQVSNSETAITPAQLAKQRLEAETFAYQEKELAQAQADSEQLQAVRRELLALMTQEPSIPEEEPAVIEETTNVKTANAYDVKHAEQLKKSLEASLHTHQASTWQEIARGKQHHNQWQKTQKIHQELDNSENNLVTNSAG